MKNFISTFIFLYASLLPSGAFASWKEKVILQTDKDLYLSGETVLFSVITTDTDNKAVDFSKVVYVELLSDRKPEVQVMVSISESSGNGYIKIPEHLETAYYRLVAYTRYMRNEGVKSFSRKLIGIVNPMTIDTSNISLQKLDVFSEIQHEKNPIHISTDKKNYSKRSAGSLKISNIPIDAQNISIVISKHEEILIPEDDIKNVNSVQSEVNPKFIAEYEGQIICAKIVGDKTIEALNSEKTDLYLSCPGEGPAIYKGKTDKDGNVTFLADKFSLRSEIATVINTETSVKPVIDILSPFAGEPIAPLPILKVDTTLLNHLLTRSVALQANRIFQTKVDTIHEQAYQSMLKPYKTYILDEYTRFSSMEDVILEFVTNVRFRKIDNARKLTVVSPEMGAYTLGNSLVLLDNIPVFDHELLLKYNPLLIDKIKIYMGKFVFGGSFFDGIVSFNTYKLDYSGFKLDATTSILNYPVLQTGISVNDVQNSIGEQYPQNTPDFRHTLIWMPDIQTNGRNELSIPFRTSDDCAKFKMCVNILTENGTMFNSIDYFNVE